MTNANTTAKQIEKAKRELAAALEAKANYLQYNKFDTFFPEEGKGKYHKGLYPKHIEFINSSSEYSQLAVIAANRVGKTTMGAYMMSMHLTGIYPSWYTGKRFKSAISAWAATKTSQMTKDVLQFELAGKYSDIGSGMIPKAQIVDTIRKAGVPEAIETIYVKHVSGGVSEVNFKSYEQGRESFQGTKKQIVWLDEEATDPTIYSECLTRTAGDDDNCGLIYCTFTPLSGITPTILSFLPDGTFDGPRAPHKKIMNIGWDDVPHLSESWKKEALASYLPHEREARSKGFPSMGAGAVYPYREEDIIVKPFEIPAHWPRAYALDVGIARTACLWGAYDPAAKSYYMYAEYYKADGVPAVHASAIKSRGSWINGVIDPSSDRRSMTDAQNTLQLYFEEGLHLAKADNAMESGISSVCQLFEQDRIKVFSTCRNFFEEFRKYKRNDDGTIPRHLQDHLMDCLRYFFVSGVHVMTSQRDYDDDDYYDDSRAGVDSVTGY